jgi:hypothetical protein
METMTLYTRDGRMVVDVQIPVFNPPVEAIIWGSRFFVRREDGKYYEGVVFPVLPALQHGERSVH